MRCAECGYEFRSWDEVWTWEEGTATEYVCEDCFTSLLCQLSAREAAEKMGLEILPPGDI